jgi:hypothetical protein
MLKYYLQFFYVQKPCKLSIKQQKMKFLKPILLLAIVFMQVNVFAQRTKPVSKFRQPKLSITLGGYKDSSFISPTVAAEIIGLPLKIVDTKNDEKMISSYNIVYRKNVITEDEETGKTSPTTSVKQALLRITPLPKLWVDALKENPKSGEFIIFYDIIVKDKEGHLMFCPNLKLYIK